MSLTPTQRSDQLRKLFQAGVDAVGGRQAVERALRSESITGSLPNALTGPVHLVALGKAADAMAHGAISALGDHLVSGLLVTKHEHLSDELRTNDRLQCLEAGHPVPDQASLEAGERLCHYVGQIPADHQLIFLVSGGTSALVEYLDEGLTLDDLKRETDKLLSSGAAIGDMNRHRRTLSRIKGGKLARQINCPVLQLLISDVPGDKPGDIGSGLLVPDAANGMPASLPVWQRISTHIIASSAIAQAAVARAADQMGLPVIQSSGNLDGDMAEVINRLSSVLRDSDLSPGVYIWGGEPTIMLPESPGRGGRNQHLALAMAPVLSAIANRAEAVEASGSSGSEDNSGNRGLSLLVGGTDGTDGPTGDAGGLVNEKTLARAQRLQLDISRSLAKADAGSCLDQLDALVTTGPTGTNVMDLAIALVE